VTLIVSQIFNRKPLKDVTDDDKIALDSPAKATPNSNLITTPSKSLPNLLQSRDYQLPKVGGRRFQ
jgi:hypothetical protein